MELEGWVFPPGALIQYNKRMKLSSQLHYGKAKKISWSQMALRVKPHSAFLKIIHYGGTNFENLPSDVLVPAICIHRCRDKVLVG